MSLFDMLRTLIILMFFSFCENEGTHIKNTENPNAFLVIFGDQPRQKTQNDQFSTGFIMYFGLLFCMC